MNVLSLFDGISVARYALELTCIDVAKYYACEIDKTAISISKKNYPSIISLGNVLNLKKEMINETIDLLIGGSPCQDLSIAKKDRKGLEGNRSSLFWEYIRLKNELKPKWFILENVASMPKKDKDIITQAIGCDPIMFNASLVSAQNRKRYFWTNIPFDLPKDSGILLNKILEPVANVVNKKHVLKNDKTGLYKIITQNPKENLGLFLTEDNKLAVVEGVKKGYSLIENNQSVDLSYSNNSKNTRRGRVGDKVKNIMTSNNIYVNQNYIIRKITPLECERLQSLPDNYTQGISNSQRYKCLGNAFNAKVISHILLGI